MGSATLGPRALAIHKYSSDHDSNASSDRRLERRKTGGQACARTAALENTELPTLYVKIDKAEREKRAAEALAMVGLAGRAQHFPSQMSGGQQ